MKRLVVLVFLIILTIPLFSQQVKVTRDFGIWIGVDFKKEISSRFDFSLMQQIRTFKNASELDDYVFDIGLKHSINKEFKIGGNLRYTYNKKRVSFRENNFRYNLDISFKKKIIPKFDLQYRLRYQMEYVDLLSYFYNPAPSDIYTVHIRNKAKLTLRVNKKNRLFFSSEIFRLTQKYRAPFFNKIRLYLGNEMKTSIGIFHYSIGFEEELDSRSPYSFILFKTIYVIRR
tara:strand:- start:916 stop:1605 length:690 start_codon:yes stop_codon:yes gene_type:complete